jgi:hypothetical protein
MVIGKYPYPTPIEQFRAAVDARRAPDKPFEAVQIPPTDSGSQPVGASTKEASPTYLSGFGNEPPSTAAVAPPRNPAAAGDVAGTVQQAGRQIARAYTASDMATVDLRSALDAYRTAGMNQDEFRRQAQASATRSLDITG